MKGEKILPVLLILLQIGAGIGYMPSGDWRKVIYWMAAAVLNIVVTF